MRLRVALFRQAGTGPRQVADSMMTEQPEEVRRTLRKVTDLDSSSQALADVPLLRFRESPTGSPDLLHISKFNQLDGNPLRLGYPAGYSLAVHGRRQDAAGEAGPFAAGIEVGPLGVEQALLVTGYAHR